MDPDPWNWTVQNVQDFFLQNELRTISGMPHSRLPSSDAFLRVLESEEIDGAVLINSIDHGFLQGYCGIKSFGTRSAVMQCIQNLRRRSRLFNERKESPAQTSPVFETAPTLPHAVEPPATHHPASARAPVTQSHPAVETPGTQGLPAVGENIRPGEVQVQDKAGRKRRKLALGPPSLSDLAVSKKANAVTNLPPPGFMPDKRLSIDEMFYGNFQLGEEVGHFPTSSEFHAEDTSDAEDNFEFIQRSSRAPAEVQYAFTQMRHFMTHQDPTSLLLPRNDRPAAAILPYREGLMPRRSATVFQLNNRGEHVAIRETVVPSTGFEVSAEPPETDDGEWRFLLEKYGNDNGDVLPALGQPQGSRPASEGEGQLSITDSDSDADSQRDSDEDDDMAEVSDRAMLDPEEARRIVEEALASYAAKWKDLRLPKLEQKQAWQVWKQKRGSRTYRDALISRAEQEIQRLDTRLRNQIDYLLNPLPEDRTDLLAVCVNLQPTVEDREEQKWRIEVWQRKDEPTHVERQPSKKAALRAGTEHEGDSHAPPEDTADSFIYSDGDGEVGVSGQASGEDTRLMSDLEQAERSPAKTLAAETSLPKTSPTKTASTKTSPTKTVSSVSEDDLPPVSSFVAQRVKPEPNQPVEPAKDTGDTDVNQLSSDSSLPITAARLPCKRGRKPGMTATVIDRLHKHDAAMNVPIQSLTAADIEALDSTKLLEGLNRAHLLIRLLYDAGPEFRENLYRCRVVPASRFAQRIEAAMLSLVEGHEPIEDLGDSQTMQYCARMFAIWYDCDNLNWLHDAVPSEKLIEMSRDARQLELFAVQVLDLLQRRDGLLFRQPAHAPPGPVVVISSDPEVAKSDRSRSVERKGSGKKRRKKVKINQSAIESRRAAFRRQEKFKTKIQLRSDSTSLAKMIASGAEHVELEINPMREEDQPPIFVNPQIAKSLKPHQIDGVRFMWREITAQGAGEGGGQGEDGGVQGCLLAHAMGLGKTLQSIATIVTITETCQSGSKEVRSQLPRQFRRFKALRRGERSLRVLILCPPQLTINWNREITQWARGALGSTFTIDFPGLPQRLRTLEEWYEVGGVLLMGYQMFRSLSNRTRADVAEDVVETIDRCLLSGPELVVADEAHYLKNQKSAVGMAASRLATRSRVALTGTPLSNDIDEVYSLISWVAPGYLGEKDEFNQRYAIPIKEGMYADSSRTEIRRSMKKLMVLRSEIEPKYHRADITALKGSLKPKIEFVLTVPLTEKQASAYKRFVSALTGDRKDFTASQVTIWAWLNALTLLTNHPSAFRQKLLTKSKPRKAKGGSREVTPSGDRGLGVDISDPLDGNVQEDQAAMESIIDEQLFAHGFNEEIVHAVIGDIEDDINHLLSAKTAIFAELLNRSLAVGDGVLVFSSTIPTLDYLSQLLLSQNIDYGRIDGSTKMEERMGQIAQMQKGDFKVMLISTRAGGIGLNMQCASRVIIFDSGFNPMHEEQAIGRAYRFGQTKPVFVYRFLAGGTFESNIENKQLFKTSLAQRVVDQKNPLRNAKRNVREWLYDPREVEQEDITKWLGKDPDVLDKLISRQSSNGCVTDGQEAGNTTKIHAIKTMETLQEDAKDPPLDEIERLEVAEEIRLSKDTRKGRTSGLYHGLVPPASTAPAGPSAASGPSTYAAGGAQLPHAATQLGASGGAQMSRSMLEPLGFPGLGSLMDLS